MGYERTYRHAAALSLRWGAVAATAVLLMLVASIIAPRPASAASAGMPDRSFGDRGVVRVGPYDAKIVTADSVGRVIVVWYRNGTGNTLVRYRRDGSRDRSFGRRGVMRVPGGTYPASLHVLPGGKLILSGEGWGNNGRRAVVLRLAGGGLDRSFASGGVALTDMEGAGRSAIAPDGRILVAGTVTEETEDSLSTAALLRLLPTGQPDASFGAGGVARIRLFRAGSDEMEVQVTGDGRAITHFRTGLRGSVVARLTTGGSVDPTFGVNGYLRERALGGLAVQADGRVLLFNALGVRRYRSDGTPDRSFGSGGFVRLAGNIQLHGRLLVDARGRILVPQTRPEEHRLPGMDKNGYDTGFARLLPNGRLDKGFGRRGVAMLRIPLDQRVDFRTQHAALAPGRSGRIYVLFHSTRPGARNPVATPWHGDTLAAMRS